MAAAYDFYQTHRYKWAIGLGLGLFLYFFLLVFLPFGVSNYNPNHQYTAEFLLEMAKFMGLTLVLTWILEFRVKPLVIRRVTIRNIFLWSAFLLVVVGLGNFLLYNWLGDWHDFSVSSALSFVLNVTTIFIFPLVGIFFYFRYRDLRRNFRQMQVQWQADPAPERLLRFEGQGTHDSLAVAASDFRYAQAQDNYVALFYIRGGELRKDLLRSPLADLLEQAGSEDLARCHRSFVVNLRQVRSFSGGHPLLLYLDQVNTPIRVSRSYREAILERLRPAAGMH